MTEHVIHSPQGIEKRHLEPRAWHRVANPAVLLCLAAILFAALFGLVGGQPHPSRSVETVEARLTLETPTRIRNGELVEMRLEIEARRAFSDLILAVSTTYWHDLTINTMIPAPAEEKSADGRYLFSYGPVAAGDRLHIKIDGQINPPLFGGTEGEIILMDGDGDGKKKISSLPVKIRVFP